MHNFIRLAIILAVIVFLLVAATPALAKGNGGPPTKGDYSVMPILGGANNNEIHVPPGNPTVSIPMDNPAIGKGVFEILEEGGG